MLVVVMAWVTIGNPAQLSTLRGEAIASALFFSELVVHLPGRFLLRVPRPHLPLGHIWSPRSRRAVLHFLPWILLVWTGRLSGARRAGGQGTTGSSPGSLWPPWPGPVSIVLMVVPQPGSRSRPGPTREPTPRLRPVDRSRPGHGLPSRGWSARSPSGPQPARPGSGRRDWWSSS